MRGQGSFRAGGSVKKIQLTTNRRDEVEPPKVVLGGLKQCKLTSFRYEKELIKENNHSNCKSVQNC